MKANRRYGWLAVLVGVAAACSGGEFTASPGGDAGSGGSSNMGGKAGGSKNAGSGSGASDAGQPSAGGDPSSAAGDDSGGTGNKGGNVGIGGDVSAGGNVSSGGKSGGANGGSAGATMSGSGGMGGAVVVVECSDPSACPAAPVCRTATCTAGKCGLKDLPNGALAQQVPGDCQQVVCQGGQKQTVIDAADSNDLNECTADGCSQAGVANHVPLGGNNCANGAGFCSFEGVCATCNKGACPVSGAECTLPLCINGTCQSAPRPAGTLCNSLNDQCDGAGHCIDCWNSGGCGECCVCSAAHVCEQT